MRAVAFEKPLNIDDEKSLIDIEINVPSPLGHDLLVEVKAVSVNPVDVKIRGNSQPKQGPRVLGWDASGIVKKVGASVSLFKEGDEVYYAGALGRAGTNAEYHLVDERIVGFKPKTLSYEEAAALPLTAITAWEVLFDRLNIVENKQNYNSLLIIGAAGGVGSIAIQLAKSLTNLTVIATASRQASRNWVLQLGADHVINHHDNFSEQFQALGLEQPGYILSTNGSENNIQNIVDVIAPQGHLALIDDPNIFNIIPFKTKSVAIHWEFMFTRSLLSTKDMLMQHILLNKVAALVDSGHLKTTLTKTLKPICASTLREAHKLVEKNNMLGKLVVSNWIT